MIKKIKKLNLTKEEVIHIYVCLKKIYDINIPPLSHEWHGLAGCAIFNEINLYWLLAYLRMLAK
jgi:hypothetical protein